MAKKLTIKYSIRPYKKSKNTYAIYCIPTYNRKKCEFRVPTYSIIENSDKKAEEKLDHILNQEGLKNWHGISKIERLLNEELERSPDNFTVIGFPDRLGFHLKPTGEHIVGALEKGINYDSLNLMVPRSFFDNLKVKLDNKLVSEEYSLGNIYEVLADYIFGLSKLYLQDDKILKSSIVNNKNLILISCYWMAFENQRAFIKSKNPFARPKLLAPELDLFYFPESNNSLVFQPLLLKYPPIEYLEFFIPGISNFLPKIFSKKELAIKSVAKELLKFIRNLKE